MTTTADSLAKQIKIDFNTIRPGSVDFSADHATDYRVIQRNTELIQVDVHTLRFINGQAKAASGEQRWRVFRLTINFWFNLLTGNAENFIVGHTPLGKAHQDFNLYADRSYWRDVWTSDPATSFAVAFVDEETDPILSIEREGDIVHWKVEIGLVCPT